MAQARRHPERQLFFTGDQGLFTLEPATPKDVGELLALDRLCFGSRAWSQAAWWEVTCWPEWTCLVLRGREKLVGAMVLLLWPPVALLSSVAVHPRCRRRGLGRRLVEDAIRRARGAGCRWLALEVDKASPAVRFYRRLGFGLLRRFREDGLERLEMVRRLRRGL